MKPLRELLLRLRQETEPPVRVVDRVRARLGRVPGALPEPSPHAVQRVAARLARRHDLLRARRRQRAGLLALAALLVIGLLPLLLDEQPPARIALSLRPAEAWQERRPTGEVQLGWKGEGEVSGLEDDLLVEWQHGTLEVGVEPGRGIRLTVQTAEARVMVLGTAFAVHRDALGTRVEVHRGRVELRCEAGPALVLGAGEQSGCIPVSPGGLLSRGRALLDIGDAAGALASVEAGLRLPGLEPALAAELAFVRVEALVALEEIDAALEAAEAALGSPGHRQAELRRLALHLAYQLGDCARIRPLLAALPEAERLEIDLGWQRHCGG